MASVDEAVTALIVSTPTTPNSIVCIFQQETWCKYRDNDYMSFFLLQAMHNYPLSDTNHLRVSFSKSTI